MLPFITNYSFRLHFCNNRSKTEQFLLKIIKIEGGGN